MARPFHPVARLIAAILLLQVVLAPAHCLVMAATPAGLAAVICSPDGTRTLHLGPDGQEAPVADEGFCPGCHAVPQVALPAAPAVAQPIALQEGPAWYAAAAEALPPPPRGPPFAPRAPPALG